MHISTPHRLLRPGALLALLFGIFGAAMPLPASADESVHGRYEVVLYKSAIIPLPKPAKHASVGNPGVADIVVARNREIYVVGKQLGSTNVTVWGHDGVPFATYDIEVGYDLEALKARLHALMPDEKIAVQSAQSHLVLSGQVSSTARMDAALQVASGFLDTYVPAQSDAPGSPQSVATRSPQSNCDENCKKARIVNLMQVGGEHQVMLQVTVAEMARSVVKRFHSQLNILSFGSEWRGGAVSGGATFPNVLNSQGLLTPVLGALDGLSPIGPPVQLLQPNLPTIENTGALLSYLSGDTFVNAILDISRRNGLARILSEPTLTTLTGQKAKFLSGGEFPIPVPQGGNSNAVTVLFKEFGVALEFTPVVLDSGRINLSIGVSVSDLAADNQLVIRTALASDSFVVPSLNKRSASSVVELGDGQTIGIAGLINDNMQDFVQKFPGLGDIPLLGQLFSSQEYRSGQTELVMFVTPHLATPTATPPQRLPTDSFVPPSDLEFYLLGRIAGGESGAKARSRRSEPPRASFGHDISPSS